MTPPDDDRSREDPGGRDDNGALVPGPLRVGAKVLLLALVVNYLVVPQFAGARRAWELISGVDMRLVGLAILVQAAAVATHAQLTRSLLPRDGRPSRFTMIRIELTNLAVSHTIPAGTAGGTAVGFQLLKQQGIRGADAGFAVAAQGIGSALVLNAMLWVALIVSIPLHGFHPLYTAGAAFGVLLAVFFAVLVLLLLKAEDRAERILRAVSRPISIVDPETVADALRRVAERVQQVASDRGVMARALGWGATYRILDVSSLWLMLLAFGHAARPDAIAIAYGLAFILAFLPVTPGGLGIVEAVLVPVLVFFGAARGEAILGAISYRLFQFWLPIPLGGLSYISLQVARSERRERWREALSTLAEQGAGAAVSLREWAERNGLTFGRRRG